MFPVMFGVLLKGAGAKAATAGALMVPAAASPTSQFSPTHQAQPCRSSANASPTAMVTESVASGRENEKGDHQVASRAAQPSRPSLGRHPSSSYVHFIKPTQSAVRRVLRGQPLATTREGSNRH
ncbi:hypothetical protein GCM10010519_00520 [Streptomyces lactacystinicus]